MVVAPAPVYKVGFLLPYRCYRTVLEFKKRCFGIWHLPLRDREGGVGSVCQELRATQQGMHMASDQGKDLLWPDRSDPDNENNYRHTEREARIFKDQA